MLTNWLTLALMNHEEEKPIGVTHLVVTLTHFLYIYGQVKQIGFVMLPFISLSSST